MLHDGDSWDCMLCNRSVPDEVMDAMRRGTPYMRAQATYDARHPIPPRTNHTQERLPMGGHL